MKLGKTLKMACAGAMAAAVLAGCGTVVLGGMTAKAGMEAKNGSKVTGAARFAQQGGDIWAVVAFDGLAPNSKHGMHVHEFGDCSARDASTAGGHFNPGHAHHGNPAGKDHHLGDLPLVVADMKGHAEASFWIKGASVQPGAGSIMGRSLVLHGSADDYMTQPGGNSGDRIACGSIVKND